MDFNPNAMPLFIATGEIRNHAGFHYHHIAFLAHR